MSVFIPVRQEYARPNTAAQKRIAMQSKLTLYSRGQRRRVAVASCRAKALVRANPVRPHAHVFLYSRVAMFACLRDRQDGLANHRSNGAHGCWNLVGKLTVVVSSKSTLQQLGTE